VRRDKEQPKGCFTGHTTRSEQARIFEAVPSQKMHRGGVLTVGAAGEEAMETSRDIRPGLGKD